MKEHQLLTEEELALLRQQFASPDEAAVPAAGDASLVLPAQCLTSSAPLYLVQDTCRFLVRYPLQMGADRQLRVGAPLIEEKGPQLRHWRARAAGEVHDRQADTVCRLADISMSGFLLVAESGVPALHQVEIEVADGEGGDLHLEAEVEAVRQVMVMNQWAVAYRFISLTQGAESLRQLIHGYHQRLADSTG